jgi:hypothetical protein
LEEGGTGKENETDLLLTQFIQQGFDQEPGTVQPGGGNIRRQHALADIEGDHHLAGLLEDR